MRELIILVFMMSNNYALHQFSISKPSTERQHQARLKLNLRRNCHFCRRNRGLLRISGGGQDPLQTINAAIDLSISEGDSCEDQSETLEAPKPDFNTLRNLALEFAKAQVNNDTTQMETLSRLKDQFFIEEIRRLSAPCSSERAPVKSNVPVSRSEHQLHPWSLENVTSPLMVCASPVFRTKGTMLGLDLSRGCLEDWICCLSGLEGKRVVCVGAGWLHAVVICSDGTALSCGDNSWGQCGLGYAGGSCDRFTVVEALRGRRAVQAAAGMGTLSW
jgi:hypothetical protein